MLCEAGYRELAVAIYQAQLELNLHPLPAGGASGSGGGQNLFDQQPWRERLIAFEQFWDGRLARVGECGARGWRQELTAARASQQQQQQQESSSAAETESECTAAEAWLSKREQLILADESLTVTGKWLLLEKLRDDMFWLPWQRRGFEDECEDMDRIVSFDSISRFLFPITSVSGQVQLVRCLVSLLEPDFELLHGPLWQDNRAPASPPSQQQQQQQQYCDDGASIDQLSGGPFCPLPASYMSHPLPPPPPPPPAAATTTTACSSSVTEGRVTRSECDWSAMGAAGHLGHVQRHTFVCRLLEQTWPLLPPPPPAAAGGGAAGGGGGGDNSAVHSSQTLQLMYIRHQLWFSPPPALTLQSTPLSSSSAAAAPSAAAAAAAEAAAVRTKSAEARRAVKRLLRAQRDSVPLFLEWARGEPAADRAKVAALLETIVAQAAQTAAVTSSATRHQLASCLLQCQWAAAAAKVSCGQQLKDRCSLLVRQLQLNQLNYTASCCQHQLLTPPPPLPSAAAAAADADIVSCWAWQCLCGGGGGRTGGGGGRSDVTTSCSSSSSGGGGSQRLGTLHQANSVFSEAVARCQLARFTNSRLAALLLGQCRFLLSAGGGAAAAVAGAMCSRQLLRHTLLAAPASAISANLLLCHLSADAGRRSLRTTAAAAAAAEVPVAVRVREEGTAAAAQPVTYLSGVSELCTLIGCCLRLSPECRFRHLVTGFLCDKCDKHSHHNCRVKTHQFAAEVRRVCRVTADMARNSPQMRRRPDFWRLSFFCRNAKSQGIPDKTSELLCYRAVQSCPWSRQLYLQLAATTSSSSSGGGGASCVQRTVQLLARAGVRVRLPLEELQLLLELEPEQLQEQHSAEQQTTEGQEEAAGGGWGGGVVGGVLTTDASNSEESDESSASCGGSDSDSAND